MGQKIKFFYVFETHRKKRHIKRRLLRGFFFLNIFSKYLGHTKRVKYILGQLSSA